jgi:hypothetical protein
LQLSHASSKCWTTCRHFKNEKQIKSWITAVITQLQCYLIARLNQNFVDVRRSMRQNLIDDYSVSYERHVLFW